MTRWRWKQQTWQFICDLPHADTHGVQNTSRCRSLASDGAMPRYCANPRWFQKIPEATQHSLLRQLAGRIRPDSQMGPPYLRPRCCQPDSCCDDPRKAQPTCPVHQGHTAREHGCRCQGKGWQCGGEGVADRHAVTIPLRASHLHLPADRKLCL